MRLVDRKGLQKYLCDVSRSTVWRYMRQGMPFIQAVKGSPYMYDLDDVDAWLKRDQKPAEKVEPAKPSGTGKPKRGHRVDLASYVARLG